MIRFFECKQYIMNLHSVCLRAHNMKRNNKRIKSDTICVAYFFGVGHTVVPRN